MSPGTKERRNARRFTLSLPMALEASGAGGPALATETRDVSARGVYFLLDSHLQEGAKFEFTLTLPPQMTLTESVRVRCRARVVRVESGKNKVGVAAVIEHYDFFDAE